jgi:biotin transporter BioY
MQRINGSVWSIDMIAIIVFAALGRQNHNESNPPLEILITAAPFMIGWSWVAWLSGALTRQPIKRWLWLTFVTNVAAVAVGLGVRSIWLSRPIPLSFAVVTFLVITALLLVVRLAQIPRIAKEVVHHE